MPRNPSTMETRRTAALNLLLGKDKEEPVPVIIQPEVDKPVSSKKKHAKAEQQKKDRDENMEDDTEEDGENDHLFSTPKRGNTPSLEDVLQVKAPSLSAFTAPASTNPGLVFPLPESSQQKESVLQKQNSNLKRRADPLGGSPIRKTAWAHSGRNETDLQIGEILDMLCTLSATVEKQNQEISELKELVKQSLQNAPKTALVPQKPKETMASRLSASLQRPTSSSGDTASTSNTSRSTQPAVSRGRPHVILDINGCDISVKERPFSEIKKHLQSCLQNYEGTRTVVLKGMNKGAKKDHRYVLFFHTEDDEKAARIHIGRWLSLAFPRAFVQTTITHRIKVNNVRADAVIDPVTNKTRDGACHELSSSSGYAISRIGWLSGPGKRYGSMVDHFMQKEDADKVLAQGLLEVGGESACTGVWIEKSG